MDDLRHDFDVLAERADYCGGLWAVRTLYRLVSTGASLLCEWPGTMDQARRLVESFADRVGHSERESLADIVQSSARATWADALDRMETSPAPEPPPPRPSDAPLSWHLDRIATS
jgi:hypothetical protein